MRTIDMLGQPCPIPVIQTKKALALPGAGGAIVLVDNQVAVQNLEKMATGLGYGFSFEDKKDGTFEVCITKTGESNTSPQQESAPTVSLPPTTGGLTVLVASDVMGRGSEELGRILIKGFLFSLTELAQPPEAVIFLNSGARLTAEGSTSLDDLRTLEAAGTTILTCGTCANFYELSDKLAIGAHTDMFTITTRLAAAGRIIAP